MNGKTLKIAALLLTLPFGVSCTLDYAVRAAAVGAGKPGVYSLIDEAAQQQPAVAAAESGPTPTDSSSPPQPDPSLQQAAPAPVAPPSLPAGTEEAAGNSPISAGEQLSAGPSLTEALDRTLDLLAKEKALNEKLREEVQSAKTLLEEKERAVRGVRLQLETCTAKNADLQKALDDEMGKWKDDILGFRDEMRTAEEAEIEVLQEILLLLKGFKAEKESR